MKLVAIAILPAILAANAYSWGSNTYGVPSYLYQATRTIETYNPAIPGYIRSHAHGSSFAGNLKNHINANYPSISIVRDDARDASVTLANIQSFNFTPYEMVFFSGHGWSGGSGFITHEKSTMNSNSVAHGGWTRWVFMDFCKYLRDHSGSNYAAMFNGLHGVFGYESDMWYYLISYDCWPWGCSHYRSEDKWKHFAAKWAKPNGMRMWDAYKEANQLYQYGQGGLGNAPAVVHNAVSGWYGASYFFGGWEYITNVFNGDVPVSTLIHEYVTYGTPTY